MHIVKDWNIATKEKTAPTTLCLALLQVSLLVSYLKSYSGMGRARISCDRGCTCRSVVSRCFNPTAFLSPS